MRQRPRSVLARAAGAEVVADEQDLRPASRLVEDERRVLARPVRLEAPVAEQGVGQALLVGHLEVARGDDLVGVDVLGRQRDDGRAEAAVRLGHFSTSADGGRCLDAGQRPRVGDDAADRRRGGGEGQARNVRPPLPWRPSKLRLEVLIAYWPGESWSPFIAMHIEQPDSRHSAPAARKISCRPSRSACAFTCWEPGTTISRTPSATCRPVQHARSEAQVADAAVGASAENTTSTGWPAMGCPGWRPMYSRACSVARCAAGPQVLGAREAAGDGDAHARIGAQVTIGSSAPASSKIDLSNRGAGIGRQLLQPATAASQATPRRVPAAVDVLEGRVVGRDHARARPALDAHVADGHARFHGQARGWPRRVYSNTWPVPPPMPILAIRARMMSLAVTPARAPVHPDFIGLRLALEQRLGGEDHLHFACPDAERERAERAVGGGVAVAADDGHARLREPSSGPMTWTMPCV